VLVVLVLLIGVHPVADEFVEEAALICAVIALAGVIVVPLIGARPSPRRRDPGRKSPPRPAFQSPALFLPDDQEPSFPLRR
jgi:hypothetical protein